MMTQLATPTRRTVESHDLASRSERGSIENSTLLCALGMGPAPSARLSYGKSNSLGLRNEAERGQCEGRLTLSTLSRIVSMESGAASSWAMSRSA